jgi:integrase
MPSSESTTPEKSTANGHVRGIYEREKGSNVWWIRFADQDGRIRRELAGTKASARKLYTLRKGEVLQGRKFGPSLRSKAVTFADIAPDALSYSKIHKRTFADDQRNMPLLLEAFADAPVDQITPKLITAKLQALATHREWQPATTNRLKALLSLAFRLAVENGRVAINPARAVRRLPEDNQVVRFLSSDELKRLRAALKSEPRYWASVSFALNTGVRAGEQFSLTWEMIDALDGQSPQLHLPVTKNGDARHIPLNASAIRALSFMKSHFSEQHLVFEPCSPYRAWFENALDAAGIKDFTWHTLRHSFASMLVMAGVDLRTVAELMGHKSLQMVMRYSHLAPEHKAAAVARLDDFLTSTKTSTKPKTLRTIRKNKSMQATVIK